MSTLIQRLREAAEWKLDQIDGADETRGRDSQLSEDARLFEEAAEELQRLKTTLLEVSQDIGTIRRSLRAEVA